MRGLNFTSLLHGNFLAFLAELDIARLRYKKASSSDCVYVENSSPPRRDLRQSIARSSLGGLVLLSSKRKQILQWISQEGEMSANRVSPTRRAGSLSCKHYLKW